MLRVHDRRRPDNDDTFRLEGGPDGAAVTRVRSTPDVTLGVAELATVYLGGTSPGTLLRAGVLAEHTAGAVPALGAALTASRLPFSRDYF